jgi:hypothetical protein
LDSLIDVVLPAIYITFNSHMFYYIYFRQSSNIIRNVSIIVVTCKHRKAYIVCNAYISI